MNFLTGIKLLFCISFLFFIEFTYAQSQKLDGFDFKKAYNEAKDKGVRSSVIDEYINQQHYKYLNAKKNHSHDSHAKTSITKTIYKSYNDPYSLGLAAPNSPQNSYCPNAGFEQYDFSNWTATAGEVSTGSGSSMFHVYTPTVNAIVSPAGANVSVINPDNFHTMITTPATTNIYPNCVGYDSIACKVVATQTISEIPLVNPNGGPSSVRMNRALIIGDNAVGCSLNYNMVLNPNNKNFSVSYAVVLYSGGSSHSAAEQPYFSVKVKDQNGTLVPGCSVYTIAINSDVTDPTSPDYDPSWTESAILTDVFYRKWATFSFDCTNYPSITSVNVEFYVGGCSLGGHFGYAYVDADCSQGGAIASFCAGSNTSVLSASSGYASYQWVGPSGPVPVSNGGNSATATISPVTAGQVFTCNVVSLNGCVSAFQTTIALTTVSITGIGSLPSCPNGNTGSANVSATGSSLGYSYQWFNSLGASVGTNQTATGLAPGTYSVLVSSPMCGSSTETVAVGNAPPLYYSLGAPFCGTTAWITMPGGAGYQWYTETPLAPISGATSSSLTINNPVDGDIYYLSYTTSGGCRDSIKYTLTQTPGGNIYVSDVKSICAGNSNAYAILNLQTDAPPVYSYSVTGPGGYSSTLTNTALLKDSVINLSIGTYTANVFDGFCLYNTTFTVNPFTYTFTVTPASSTICALGNTTLTADFGNTVPSSCGLTSSGNCVGSNIIQVGSGTTANTEFTYPAIYGNFYENTRHQILYRASELLSAGVLPGKISSIAFNITNINGSITNYPGFTIKMKCTTVTSLNTVFDNNGLVQVFFSPSVNITSGWNTYTFPVPYEWDGVSNILVDVCNAITNGYTENASTPFTTTSYNSLRYYNIDGPTVACMTTNAATTSAKRPNTRFGNCAGSNPSLFTYTWTPSFGLSSTTSYSTVANPSVTTVYTVDVNPMGQTNCVQSHTSIIVVSDLPTFTITPVNPLCTNASSISLTAIPAGGTWSGSGVSSTGVLTPSIASVGNNKIIYNITNGPCVKKDSIFVNVVQYVPATITGSVGPFCIYDKTIDLQSITQFTNGVWLGNGVTGTDFSPTLAGAGTHTLSYSTDPAPTGVCPDQQFTSIVVNPKPEVNAIVNIINGCTPLSVIYSTTSVNTGNAVWDFGDTTSTMTGIVAPHTYNKYGIYQAVLTYTDNLGCVDTTKAASAVTVYSVPVAAFDASPSITTIVAADIQFDNQTTNLNNNTYEWNFGTGFTDNSIEINPMYLYTNSGEYMIRLIATSSDGCKDTAVEKIIVNPDVVLFVPNTFTPGGDGLNDEFQIVLPPTGVDFSSFNLTIYNRWGDIMYKTNDVNKRWNGGKNNSGELLKQDIYVWKITFNDENRKAHEKLGHVLLLRR